MYNIFVINPGSTSTKVALYQSDRCLCESTIRHDASELENFETIMEQFEFRYNVIENFLDEMCQKKICQSCEDIDAFVGRGGLMKPLISGTYRVNKDMLDDLTSARFGSHASNLGAVIASKLADKYRKNAYVVNPVVVDELMEEARFTGLPSIKRKSVFHALNQKAAALLAAEDAGIDYSEGNFIVAHLGGGISVGAHDHGRVVDVNNAIEEGPFSPERAGNLPFFELVDLCFSGKYTEREIRKMLVGRGGLFAYFGTTDVREIEEKAKNDKDIKIVLDAMLYRISREICACAATLYGKVDRVVVTGGIAHSQYIIDELRKRVGFLGKMYILPGEDEMAALASGVTRVLTGREKALSY